MELAILTLVAFIAFIALRALRWMETPLNSLAQTRDIYYIANGNIRIRFLSVRLSTTQNTDNGRLALRAASWSKFSIADVV